MHRTHMHHTHMPYLQDFEYGVRQGAAIERLLEGGRLPPNIASVLSGLSGAMYGGQRQRAQGLFRQLDGGRTG